MCLSQTTYLTAETLSIALQILIRDELPPEVSPEVTAGKSDSHYLNLHSWKGEAWVAFNLKIFKGLGFWSVLVYFSFETFVK